MFGLMRVPECNLPLQIVDDLLSLLTPSPLQPFITRLHTSGRGRILGVFEEVQKAPDAQVTTRFLLVREFIGRGQEGQGFAWCE